MDLIGILYSAHVQQTSLDPSPFPYVFIFSREMFKKDKYMSLARNSEEFEKFVKKCYDKFIERHPGVARGSVHHNPKTWVKFALKGIAKAWKENSREVTFPNGCCSMNEKCPINMFYEIVLEELCLDDEEELIKANDQDNE